MQQVMLWRRIDGLDGVGVKHRVGGSLFPRLSAVRTVLVLGEAAVARGGLKAGQVRHHERGTPRMPRRSGPSFASHDPKPPNSTIRNLHPWCSPPQPRDDFRRPELQLAADAKNHVSRGRGFAGLRVPGRSRRAEPPALTGTESTQSRWDTRFRRPCPKGAQVNPQTLERLRRSGSTVPGISNKCRTAIPDPLIGVPEWPSKQDFLWIQGDSNP